MTLNKIKIVSIVYESGLIFSNSAPIVSILIMISRSASWCKYGLSNMPSYIIL